MRHYLLGSVLTLALTACSQQSQEAQSPQTQGEYDTSLSVREIMDGIIDPNADIVWDSVATIIDDKGVSEKFPRTDEEWAAVRRGAIALIESSNLLMMPGRPVAPPGARAGDPSELDPEKIEALLSADRVSWNNHALELRKSSKEVLQAIDQKDSEGVLRIGESIYYSCEGCHAQYWFPENPAPTN